jgi:hypothetical protein
MAEFAGNREQGLDFEIYICYIFLERMKQLSEQSQLTAILVIIKFNTSPMQFSAWVIRFSIGRFISTDQNLYNGEHCKLQIMQRFSIVYLSQFI